MGIHTQEPVTLKGTAAPLRWQSVMISPSTATFIEGQGNIQGIRILSFIVVKICKVKKVKTPTV
jgi:hypothetical protein